MLDVILIENEAIDSKRKSGSLGELCKFCIEKADDLVN